MINGGVFFIYFHSTLTVQGDVLVLLQGFRHLKYRMLSLSVTLHSPFLHVLHFILPLTLLQVVIVQGVVFAIGNVFL